jgi:hypothetical protein
MMDGGCLTCRSPHLAVPSRFERAPETAPVRHPRWDCEEGRGLDPQWRTTRSLSKRCRSPDRLTFRVGGWRSTRSPCLAAPSVFKAAPASLAGSPSMDLPTGVEPAQYPRSKRGALPLSYGRIKNRARHPSTDNQAMTRANSSAGSIASPRGARLVSARRAPEWASYRACCPS